jgi:pimeloyl-ACP methyl ester carboxylesterase
VIAIELGAAHPDRVDRLVLSASPFVDAADRERRRGRPPIDHVDVAEDGSHLVELWRRRLGFYPKGRPDLLARFVVDALRAGERAEEGHRACGAYRMEDKVGRIRCPTLVVCGTEDPFSFPRMELVARHITGARAVPIPGGTVAMVDQMPEAFAAAIHDFLRS